MMPKTVQRITLPFLVLLAAALHAQQPAAPAQPAQTSAQQQQPGKHVSSADRRRAAKVFLDGAKLYQQSSFEQAMKLYQRAAELDPSNKDYPLAVEIARSHAVNALIQQAAKAHVQGDKAAARAALIHAQQIDPQNADIAEHINQLADETVADTIAATGARPAQPRFRFAEPDQLAHTDTTQSFHQRGSQSQIVQQVFRAYGITAAVDTSVNGATVRIDLDDAHFDEAMRVLSLLTNSFYVVLDPHRVLVARDTPNLRQQFERNVSETINLAGMSQKQMEDVANFAKTVLGVKQTGLNSGSSMLALMGPESTIKAFNASYGTLLDTRPEVLIDVRVIELAHTSDRNTGVQLPQQTSVFNVLSQADSILNANQALVQQIIASGLAGPNDIGTILAILLASGQVSSSVFTNGFAIFGGSCSTTSGTCSPTAFGLSPGGTTLNLSLNTSDARTLDDYQLRLEDGEDGTLKSGTHYPITTSTYSSTASNSLNIPGLTSSGTSGSLSGILSSLSGTTTTIPLIQYQDIGLVLKATPHVTRAGDVSLKVDMQISSLQGTSLNGIPVLDNQSLSGVATIPANNAVVIASELSSSEVRAINGTSGLSEIPGLSDVTDKDTQKSTATLLIVMTPHVVRGQMMQDQSPMIPLERTSVAR